MTFILWRYNLRFSRGGLIAWGLVVFGYTLLQFWTYSSFREQGANLLAYLESFPELLRSAVGLGGETWESLLGTNGISIEAWLNMEYLIWLPLLLGIYALFSGSGSIAREVERGTLELLLSFPLSRYQVVLVKFSVFVVVLIVLMALSVAGVMVGVALIGEDINLPHLLLAHLQALLLIVAIAAYSILASCFFLNPRRALTAAGLFTAAAYILNFLSPALGSLKWLAKGSLFYYYQPLPILLKGEIDLAGTLLYIAAAGVALLLALLVFERRDILPG